MTTDKFDQLAHALIDLDAYVVAGHIHAQTGAEMRVTRAETGLGPTFSIWPGADPITDAEAANLLLSMGFRNGSAPTVRPQPPGRVTLNFGVCVKVFLNPQHNPVAQEK